MKPKSSLTTLRFACIQIVLYVLLFVAFAPTAEAQNVGIGTNTPTKKLDVNGDELVGYITPRYTGPASIVVTTVAPTFTATFVQSFTWTGNEHLYVLFSTSASISWLQAQELARAVKGYLVTVTSTEENDFIRNNILALPTAQGHIPVGHTDALTEGRWDRVTGEISVLGQGAVFTNWAPGEPNDGLGTGEDIAHFLATSTDATRRWNDWPPTLVGFNAVIVEFSYLIRP